MPCRIFCCHFWVGACPLKPQKWASGQHRLWNCQSKNYLPCNQRLQKMKIRPLEDGWRFAVFFFLTFRILVLYWSLIAFIASKKVQKGRLGQVGLQSGNATMLETIGWYGIFYIQGFFGNRVHYWLLGTFEPLELLIVENDIFRKNYPPRGSWRVQPHVAGSMNHTSPLRYPFQKYIFAKWLSSFLSNKFLNGSQQIPIFPKIYSYQWNLRASKSRPKVQRYGPGMEVSQSPTAPSQAAMLGFFDSPEVEAAAIRIQAVERGRQQRKQLKMMEKTTEVMDVMDVVDVEVVMGMGLGWKWEVERLEWCEGCVFFLRKVTVFSARSQRCGKFM